MTIFSTIFYKIKQKLKSLEDLKNLIKLINLSKSKITDLSYVYKIFNCKLVLKIIVIKILYKKSANHNN